ncbi:MAG TPA: nitronate monooxygenase family protein [Thiobacillus sp.]|nr:nitronate monooxygenase family protein [Thiobacillus sp.]
MTTPRSFAIRGRALLPIVQGGMGVGVSAHRLAGAVARAGAMGTIASIDLRHHHADLTEQGKHCRDKDELNRLNFIALDREIGAALDIAAGHGLVAVNVMKAVDAHPAYVRQACDSGAQAIVMGAGLPLDLAELTEGYPEVALIPILSDARGAAIVLKKLARKGRLPDAMVIEHPQYAGGHLGAPNPADLANARFGLAEVLPGIFKVFDDMGIAREQIPVIVGGGINSHEKVLAALALGAAAVQVGTPFAVTEEGDAHLNFKRVLLDAKPEDIVTFMSVAGLPARAVKTPWLANYLKRESKLQAVAKADPNRCAIGLHCLTQCGLRDGLKKAGQFCIDSQLVAALKGEVNKGLFFRGSESLPFSSAIRSVQELIDYLLTGMKPDFGAPA